jgi:hypothetical protein
MDPTDHMIRPWQTKLFGAGLGAGLSLLLAALGLGLAIIGMPIIIVAFVGLLGAPVGAILGLVLSGRVLASSTPGKLAFIIGLAAALLGGLLYACLVVVGQSAGATLGQVLALAPGYFLYIGLYGLLFGAPLTILVAFVAVGLLRRFASAAGLLWIPSAILLTLMAGALGVGVASGRAAIGDQAAQQGDLVSFQYQIENHSNVDYMFDVRSHWAGAASSGSSQSSLAACSSGSGSDWLQSSDWAIFLTKGQDSEWQDQPTSAPIITNRDWPAGGSVVLIISIDATGVISVTRGQPGQGFTQTLGGGTVSQGQAFQSLGSAISGC